MALISGRTLRWASLAIAVPTVWACNARPLATPDPQLDVSTFDIYQRTDDGVAVLIDPSCLRGEVLDTTGAPWTGTTTPDCAIVDHGLDDQNMVVDTALPACAPDEENGPTACWYLTKSEVCAPGALLNINRPAGPLVLDLDSTVSCSVLPR